MSADGSASRVISSSFAAASAERSSAQAVSPERAAKIASWADRTTARAEREFRENREQWTRRQYGELLARAGERLELRSEERPGGNEWASTSRSRWSPYN